jgi:flagellar biosynthesis protein FlhG
MDQAAGLRKMFAQTRQSCRTIAVTAGKGGVGKTSMAVNLAIAIAKQKKRVILLDLDLGLANVDILLNISPKYHIGDILFKGKTLDEVIIDVPGNMKLLPGATGIEALADISDDAREKLIEVLKELEFKADYLIIDTGAGISQNVISFVAAADEALVIATPEPTSIIDAYATIKRLSKEDKDISIKLVINEARNQFEADNVSRKMLELTTRFLNIYIEYLGFIQLDYAVSESVKKQNPFLLLFPTSTASYNVNAIARKIIQNDNWGTATHATRDKEKSFVDKVRKWFGLR